jgi:hypothetical protein
MAGRKNHEVSIPLRERSRSRLRTPPMLVSTPDRLLVDMKSGGGGFKDRLVYGRSHD